MHYLIITAQGRGDSRKLQFPVTPRRSDTRTSLCSFRTLSTTVAFSAGVRGVFHVPKHWVPFVQGVGCCHPGVCPICQRRSPPQLHTQSRMLTHLYTAPLHTSFSPRHFCPGLCTPSLPPSQSELTGLMSHTLAACCLQPVNLK